MRLTAVVPLLVLLPLAAYAASRDLAPAVRAEMVSERRVALVIGNGAYSSSPLKNPPNDAKAMAAALSKLGFEVMHHQDIDQTEMRRAIRDFGERLEQGGVGLFYYAGHGMQVDGRNYLIPVRSDALIQKESDVELEAVDLGRVLGTMKGAKNRLNIVVLDACRNNPFARSFRSGSRGLAEVHAPVGTFIAYATAAGSVAADGDGANGAYTEALLRHIQTPGEQLEMVFKSVRTDVYQASGGAQVPWDNNSILGEFYFMLPPEGDQGSSAPVPTPRPSILAEHGYRMVQIRPGSFSMGSPESEEGRDDDETQHTVKITRAFELGATEVTQGLWNSVMGSNPSSFSSCGDTCPVAQVSWLDSVAFANKLSAKEGLEECYRISGETVTWPKGLACQGYRLPTEAEWEYAARAGGDTLYAGSNDEYSVARGMVDTGKNLHPVGSLAGNAWGLYDMSGNANEWTWDWYEKNYQSGSSVDPIGPQSGSYRVIRGGSVADPFSLRIARRGGTEPYRRIWPFGLRLSKSIP